jgi:acyl carrier protein
VVLKQLPLTNNGKLDRQALPAPQTRPEEIGEYVAPRTDLERALAEIWTQVLRVDQVGVQDNFFELGGHSLVATRVIAHINHLLDMEVPIRLLFEKPTVEALGASIVERIAAEASAEVV